MARCKRVTERLEAPERANKRQRVHGGYADPSLQPNRRNDDEEELGRPGPSSYQDALPQQQQPSQRRNLGSLPQINTSQPPIPSQPLPATNTGSASSDSSTYYAQSARNYDVAWGVTSVGKASDEDYAFWGHEEGAPRFIRSRAGIDDKMGTWIGVRPLGKGGFGL